ncbi:MAG: aquaporin [Verrucomicrobiota bacterium]|nr:aquaporin [Verrucomicrobiota bacterium]
MLQTLKRHWPEYIFEAVGLALCMIFAGGLTTLLEHPESPVHQALPSKMLRHVLLGLVMGTYIALLIYSPWGRRTGAHINPTVTIAFWRMGKIGKADAIFTSSRSLSARSSPRGCCSGRSVARSLIQM